MIFCKQALVVYGDSADVFHLGMRYWHDCRRCVPLGRWKEFDLYYCAGPHPTVVARYGDKGYEYLSGIGVGVEPLRVACRRAAEIGLKLYE